MTADQANRVRGAIAECDKFISKESACIDALRPAHVAELLAWYIGHRAKLVEMLEAA